DSRRGRRFRGARDGRAHRSCGGRGAGRGDSGQELAAIDLRTRILACHGFLLLRLTALARSLKRDSNPGEVSSGLPVTVPPRGKPRYLPLDRKSTRLNSSHDQISYAVFCLKKKKKKNKNTIK